MVAERSRAGHCRLSRLDDAGRRWRVRSALTGCRVVAVHNMFTMPFNWESSKTMALLSHEMHDARFINCEIVHCDAGNRLRGWRG